METQEILTYVREKHLEYQMAELLLFNNDNFFFLPVPGAYIQKVSSNAYTIMDNLHGNILSTDCQPGFVFVSSELENSVIFKKCLTHPEHLHVCLLRYHNSLYGTIIYSKKNTWQIELLERAFEFYLDVTQVTDLTILQKRISEAKKRKDSIKALALDFSSLKPFLDYFFVDTVFFSYDYNGIDWKKMDTGIIGSAIVASEKNALCERYISSYALMLNPPVFDYRTLFLFRIDYKPYPNILTPLDKDVTLIDGKDDISEILYRIAIDIKPNKFYAATGYAYESGLNMIESALFATVMQGNSDTELIIGDLQKYKEGNHQKSPNRATVRAINLLINVGTLSHLYTYPKRFYHGKFYYISNGNITYIITGSSNITESAYLKNKELDVMFRFDTTRGNNIELLSTFMTWYQDLRAECIELKSLDDSLFSSTLVIDEHGNTSTDESLSFVRSLTDEEEQARYQSLLKFSPDKIDEHFIPRHLEYKPFRGYVAFFYYDYGITVLENFTYGNSCFVFSCLERNVILSELASKSKLQIQNSMYYMADIAHNDGYAANLEQVFKNNSPGMLN